MFLAVLPVRFVERSGILGSVRRDPRVERVADDHEQPAARILTPEVVEITQRPQVSFLNDVLCILRIARQPSGYAIGIVEVGKRDCLETRDPRLVINGTIKRNDGRGACRVAPLIKAVAVSCTGQILWLPGTKRSPREGRYRRAA